MYYKDLQERDPGLKEETYQIYNRFDVKNFDVKTDGTSVTYKPEYHESKVNSNVFIPFNKKSFGQIELKDLRYRKAIENRKKAKYDRTRKEKLKSMFNAENPSQDNN